MIKIKRSKDSNGNTLAKIKVGNERAFSIQTNGNLPQIHREFSQGWENSYNSKEVREYVSKHGTKHQKKILGIS